MAARRWPKGTYMQLRNPDLLRQLMRDQQVSQKQLAQFSRRANGSAPTPGAINHLVTGRKRTATPAFAASIAEVLKVDVSVLFMERAACKKTSDHVRCDRPECSGVTQSSTESLR